LKKDYDRYLALAVLKLKMEIRSRQRIITNTLNTISGRVLRAPRNVETRRCGSIPLVVAKDRLFRVG